MRTSYFPRLVVALAAVLTLGTGTASAQVTPFYQDIGTAIDNGLAWLDANGAFANPSPAEDGAGLVALALLEKHVDNDPLLPVPGYSAASPADQAKLDAIMSYIIARATSAGWFYAYRDGADLMALSVYLRTGGPNQAGASAAINSVFDRIAVSQGAGFTAGYWCYSGGGCRDASTTQFVMAGLAAARGVFSDPAYADPSRLATLNTLTANSQAAYAANGLPGGQGIVDPSEKGHGYTWGGNSIQQTASGTWAQVVGGADVNDAGVQAYLRWLYNRYRYTNVCTNGDTFGNGPGLDQGWCRSFYYYLWSFSKALAFIEDSAVTPLPGNLGAQSLGTLPSGDAPAYSFRELHRDPLTDPRVPLFGAGGPGYYGAEAARWYYDFAYTLLANQDAAGLFNNPDEADWSSFHGLLLANVVDQAYAILVLERSVGGGCIDTDDDGICDADDNCPAIANPNQEDTDGDTVGDVCDQCPGQDDRTDANGNGIPDCLENRPPVCTAAAADPSMIWPPNHQFVPISILGVTDPDGDPLTIAVTDIFQDEPPTGGGQGAGNTPYDGILDPLQVRAERNGNPKTPGDGRVYHVTFTATDSSGASCTATVTICVPHDQRPGATCVDGGPLVKSTQ